MAFVFIGNDSGKVNEKVDVPMLRWGFICQTPRYKVIEFLKLCLFPMLSAHSMFTITYILFTNIVVYSWILHIYACSFVPVKQN